MSHGEETIELIEASERWNNTVDKRVSFATDLGQLILVQVSTRCSKSIHGKENRKDRSEEVALASSSIRGYRLFDRLDQYIGISNTKNTVPIAAMAIQMVAIIRSSR